MSFRLKVESVENQAGETCIQGRVVAGAYAGPQYIRFKDAAGREQTSRILSHALIDAQDWPVAAGHKTQLLLYIADQYGPIAPGILIEGLGSVMLCQDSTDLTRELSNPLFWGNFAASFMNSETYEEPYEEFLGLSSKEVDAYYSEFLSPLVDSAAWPVFPLDIDGNRYAEIEWAGGAEYQDRLWIGSKDSGERALLGYNSGHFSLPALRPSELVWLLDVLERGKYHPAWGLLLVPLCYLPEADAALTERLAALCAQIPAANAELSRAMARNLVDHQVVPDAKWQWHPKRGWCSDWIYSQRNPQSPMSVLSESGYRFIGAFFSDPSCQ